MSSGTVKEGYKVKPCLQNKILSVNYKDLEGSFNPPKPMRLEVLRKRHKALLNCPSIHSGDTRSGPRNSQHTEWKLESLMSIFATQEHGGSHPSPIAEDTGTELGKWLRNAVS